MSGFLKIKQDTYFKQDPLQEAQHLSNGNKAEIAAGSNISFAYITFAKYLGKPFHEHMHLEVHCDPPVKSISGDDIQTWFVYADDIDEIR